MVGRIFLTCILAGLLTSIPLFPAARVLAADIEPSLRGDCRLVLRGRIGTGDFERFLAAAKLHFPGNNGESTSGDVICLDSPGGSLTEGVKFARHFYEQGVGTRIEDGASCHSSCAIMFMMGLAQGSEVSFINRKMHVGGTLGFHRPFLAPQLEGTIGVSGQDLAEVYDIALQSALDLIEMANRKSPWANEPMMMPDLVQQMLTHVGDDMFLVDDVDRAARFKIDLIGLPDAPALTEESAFYACENGLQWQIGLTSEDIRYTADVAEQYGHRRVQRLPSPNGQEAFSVEGLANGYALESCIITKTDAGVAGCGTDEYTGVGLGTGTCTTDGFRSDAETLHPLAVYYPWTKLASLKRPEIVRGDAANAFRCRVLRKGSVVDDEACSMSLRRSTSEKWPSGIVAEFTWPSGAKTVVQREGGRAEVNGTATVAREDNAFGTCFLNRSSGNDFCVRRAEP